MTPAMYLLAAIGAACTASLLTRFIVWLDTPREEAAPEDTHA